jgi:hypothetical protein
MHYPESGINGKAIGMLAIDYHLDLTEAGVTSAQFDYAMIKVRQKCGFFPKVKDFMEAVRGYREQPPRPAASNLLPEETSGKEWLEEEMELNRQKFVVLIDQSLGKITQKVAEKKIEALEKKLLVFAGKMVK